MNRSILVQVTAPAVILGLLLVGACLVIGWHVNQLQANTASILRENLASLQASQQLRTNLGRMRSLCLLYLIEPDPDLLPTIQEYEKHFEEWLERARQTAHTAEEQVHIRAIEKGYARYLNEFEQARDDVVRHGPRRDYRQVADANMVRYVFDPCQDFFRDNEKLIVQTSHESDRISAVLRWTLLILGLAGPLSGLMVGYSVARGLSRSIHHLSVHVQDMTQRLDQDVCSVRVAADNDLPTLDKQLRYVVHRVEEVVERTQRHQREMLRAQQLAAVGQLAASMAHEVRNPLTSIKMLVEAAQRTRNAKPFTPDALNVIHDEVIRLERTVQSFLDFAKPPALERVACDVRDVVAQSVELVRTRAAKQKVEMVARSPAQPVTCDVDRGQIRTVLVNLFINALDAMPDGGRLEITTEHFPNQEVVLTVNDTGKGICRDIFDRLFTPFTSSKPAGTGLGLCVSKRIVEEHGGRLTAINRPEKGAQFTVLLPEGR